MKTVYLKIIFGFLLITAILQAVFAQTAIQKPMFKNKYVLLDQDGIHVVLNPKDSLYVYDTIHSPLNFRDFFYSKDSIYVKHMLNKMKSGI
jgi:hypothetical protein